MDCKRNPPCNYEDMNCMCFAYSGSTNPTRDQFCGYLMEDGKTVRPCATTCCNGGLGCPGQCRDVDPKRPDYIIEGGDIEKTPTVFSSVERLMKFENMLTLIMVLMLISTLCLFIRI